MSLEAAGNHSWTEIAEEVGCSRQTVYRVLKPNKAKEHRNNDITKYYPLLTILKDTRQHILTELSFEQQVQFRKTLRDELPLLQLMIEDR